MIGQEFFDIHFVLIYIRKSREDIELEKQTGEDTLARHRELLTGLARSMGYVYEIREEVKTGDSIASRPVFQQVLYEDIPTERYDAIMVTELSRLGRGEMKDAGEIMDTVRDNNLYIVTPNKIYDIHNPADARQIRFELFLAREEYELIKERLIRGKDIKAERGMSPVGVSYTLGYRSIGRGRIEIVEDEAKVVRYIFEQYAEGLSGQQIADKLNDMGRKTKKGTKYHQTTIQKILKNQIYIGNIKYRGKWLDGIHEPILDMGLWERAQAVRRAKSFRSYSRKDSPYYLKISCKYCGNNMHGDKQKSGHKVYRNYRCRNTNHPYNIIAMEKAHYLARKELNRLVSRPDILNKRIKMSQKKNQDVKQKYQKQIADIENEIKRKQQTIDKARMDYEKGDLPAALYTDTWQSNKKEIVALKKEKQSLFKMITQLNVDRSTYSLDAAAFLLENWDNVPDYKKGLILNSFFPKIEAKHQKAVFHAIYED